MMKKHLPNIRNAHSHLRTIASVIFVLMTCLAMANKPAVWLISDGGNNINDPDDISAVASYLLMSNMFDTRAIVMASTSLAKNKNTPDQGEWARETYGQAYAADLSNLNKYIGGYQEEILYLESSVKGLGDFNPSQSYDLNDYPSIKSLFEELAKSDEVINILCYGPLTEQAILVSYCLEKARTDVLEKMRFISHWTNSNFHVGTITNPDSTHNCFGDAIACDYMKRVALDGTIKFYECGGIGQHGIVEEAPKGKVYYDQYKTSHLGKIFAEGKFRKNRVDDSDSATYWTLLGKYGVSLNDIADNGRNHPAVEQRNEASFARNAKDMREELLRRSQAASGINPDNPPNIIFIMADDHTTQGFGSYGSRLAKLNPTPNIDRLANEGMLFENAFCTNSICTPSRASIMTGQYGHVNGVYDLSGYLTKENQRLPIELSELGYQTAMVGKWHLKHAPDAFDYYNVLPGQGLYFDPILYNSENIGEKTDIKFNQGMNREVYAQKYTGHSSDVITDIALDWLKTKRTKDKPFFLMHHFKAPHDFFEFAPRYKDYLEDVEIPEPSSLWYNANNGSVGTRGQNDSLIDTIGSSIGHRNIIRNMGMHMEIDPNIPDPEYKKLAYQEYLKRYLRCVKGVDDNVKRLFDYLEAEGIMDNTIIIYTGDQGFMLGEHDYIDKRWMYEESMRMPFLVRYPKTIKAGSRTDAIINNTDFAPTILELAGGAKANYMQGSSFKSILETGNEPEGWQQETYYRYWMHMAHKHNNPGHFGIRTKQYKLIFFYGRDYKTRSGKAQKWANNPASMSNFETPPAWEFYDLINDPEEMDNRYGHEKYAGIIKDLKQKLKSLRAEIKEDDSDFPEIEKVVKEYWNQ